MRTCETNNECQKVVKLGRAKYTIETYNGLKCD